MLKKIKLSFADKRNLAHKSAETAPINVDWSKIVVNKPWGYEYLLTNTPLVEVWHLSLGYLKSTSIHCHPNKKTALIVLDGRAKFSTLNRSVNLFPLDAVIMEAGVFHSTKCLSGDGLKLLEVETPPMKHDLVRLKDKYGRANAGYEGKDKMRMINNSYLKFEGESTRTLKNFCHNHLCIHFLRDGDDLTDVFSKNLDLAVILNGFVKSTDKKIMHRVGDVIEPEKLKNKKIEFNNATLLSISKMPKPEPGCNI